MRKGKAIDEKEMLSIFLELLIDHYPTVLLEVSRQSLLLYSGIVKLYPMSPYRSDDDVRADGDKVIG